MKYVIITLDVEAWYYSDDRKTKKLMRQANYHLTKGVTLDGLCKIHGLPVTDEIKMSLKTKGKAEYHLSEKFYITYKITHHKPWVDRKNKVRSIYD